jgi:hypothetical protein
LKGTALDLRTGFAQQAERLLSNVLKLDSTGSGSRSTMKTFKVRRGSGGKPEMHFGIIDLVVISLFLSAATSGDPSPTAVDEAAATAELSKGVNLTTFKAWEGTYEASRSAGSEASSVAITDCNALGCAFDAEASFGTEATEDTPQFSGACSYEGRFRFLSETTAVAWDSSGLGDFTGEMNKLKTLKKDKVWTRLGFDRKGPRLDFDDSAANGRGFCGVHPAEFLPMVLRFVPPKGGPAFDCTKATSETEKAICANPPLAALDLDLSSRFALARTGASRSRRASLSQGQKEFLKQRDACGANVTCIKTRYEDRLRTLTKS